MILAVAPTGARRGKGDHSHLPMTVEEISAEARACADAGASLLHLHVRRRDGSHSIDAGLYKEAIAAVRAETGNRLFIQATTEAAGIFSRTEQISAATSFRPDSISLAVREICPDAETEAVAKHLYDLLSSRRILVQHIAYDPADLMRLSNLRERGVIPDKPLFVQLVLGRYGGGREGNRQDFDAFLPLLDTRPLVWSLCCFGPWEGKAVEAAASSGGHVRVGFENNLIGLNGAMATSNAQLVAEAATMIRAAGRSLAAVADIREMFSIQND